ncbi:MAG: hypothetical protein JO179_22030 [Solirubrobacterales bacterium]|nr:hypothetical protein [Solirubrobacterales bacterium]
MLIRRFAPSFLAFVASILTAWALITPAPASAASGGQAKAAACRTDVTFGLIEAKTTGCLNEVSPSAWETTDTVDVNGVPLTPAPGTQLRLDGPTKESPGGSLSVRASLVVAGVKFESGLLTWKLPEGREGDERSVLSTGEVNGEKLFGFDISGSADIRVGWDARNGLHYFKFIANLALPSVFKNGPEQGAGGLTATVGLRVDSAGVHADAVKAQVSNAYIGTLQVKSLCLSFVGAGSSTEPCSPPLHGAQQLLTCTNPGDVDRWDGSAEVVLPTADRPEVGVWAGVQNGMFSYAGGQALHLGNSLPIASGVYLDSVGLAVCISPPPIKFKGAMGIRLGPEINGSGAVTIHGSLEYVDSTPWVIEARGSVEVFGYQVADGFLRYQSDNTIDFGFHINLDFTLAQIEAGVDGWIEARTPFRFNVDGYGKVCVLKVACLSGEVTASSDGLAGCVTVLEGDYWTLEKDADWEWWAFWRVHWVTHHWRARAGAGIRWAGGGVHVMGDECDVGPYRAARSARATAVGVSTLQVARGSQALALQVQGQSAAPGLDVVSPTGIHYRTPRAAAQIVPGRDMFVKDPVHDATDVLIGNPVAGTWTIRAARGSRIMAVREAEVDPRPTIDAGVGGSGERRILSYADQRQPFHSTRFVEEGTKYEQELGTARGGGCKGVPSVHPDPPACGQIRFTPAPGPAGVRHIYAITTMNGEVTDKQLVATYRAPAEPEPSMVPKLVVRRIHNAIAISFATSHAAIRAAQPVDYNLDVILTDGRKLLVILPAHDRRVTVHNVSSQLGARIQIAGMRRDDTEGRIRTLILKPRRSTASS